MISSKYNTQKEIISKYPITNYVKKAFYLINQIRTNPSEFISVIEQAEKYIKEQNGRKIFEDNGLKILLHEGKSMFKDCIEYLKTLNPMEELNFCDDIVIQCPTEEVKIKDKNIFKENVLTKKKQCGIVAYFRDAICIPEISVLLMIVDDSIKNPKKKRETLLNPNYKLIGISASDINYSNDINRINSQKDNLEQNKENENKDLIMNNQNNEEINIINNNNKSDYNNNINEENGIVKNDNNLNKLQKNEIKYKPFCAYFTLK